MVILIFLMSIADSGKADFSDSCMFMNKKWENSLL
ncbi:unknown [Prevotella sp. CAG:1058]|nr:unknown [Prevotella sp. CAG:1058]